MSVTLTLIEVWEPGVVFFFVGLIIVGRTLNAPKAWHPFRAWFGVANFIAASLTDAKFTPMRRLRMITLPLNNRDACSTRPGTTAPLTPFSPTTIDGAWHVYDGYALLVLTPLKNKTSKPGVQSCGSEHTSKSQFPVGARVPRYIA